MSNQNEAVPLKRITLKAGEAQPIEHVSFPDGFAAEMQEEHGVGEVLRRYPKLVRELNGLRKTLESTLKHRDHVFERLGVFERENVALRQRLAPQDGSIAEHAHQLAGHLRESSESLGDVVGVQGETVGEFLAQDAQSIADATVMLERDLTRAQNMREHYERKYHAAEESRIALIEALRGASKDACYVECEECEGTGGEPIYDDGGEVTGHFDPYEDPCEDCMGAGRMPS